MGQNFLTTVQGWVNGAVRTVKVLLYGAKDIRSAPEAGPFGVDSGVIKGMKAVYLQTEKKGEVVLVGYYNDGVKPLPNKPIAEKGATRLYATDDQGNFKFNVWLRANGEVLIGDSKVPAAYVNWFVKYTELNAALQAQATLINSNTTAIATVLNSLVGPGTYTPIPVVVNITAAKASKVKTI